MSSALILAIESSCDDTSAAIIHNDKILANITANQDVHKQYGGVVPELASRSHQKNIVPVVDRAFKVAGVEKSQIQAVAYTRGPGLLGSLLVGTSFAKSFALGMNVPLIEVNHMQAHVLAHFIKENDASVVPDFPFLCLTVSGGHTQQVLVKDYFDMEIIGETIDDAAGEAFDKVAKMLGLDYPGGPLIDKHAKLGDPLKFKFPHPRVGELDFSFSGLKTSVLYFLRDQKLKNKNFIQENLNDICASVQYTIIEILLGKLTKAAEMTGVKCVGVAGGVSANSALRMGLEKAGNQNNWKTFIPKFEYCTDNAAMIGIAGYYKYRKGEFSNQNAAPIAGMSF